MHLLCEIGTSGRAIVCICNSYPHFVTHLAPIIVEQLPHFSLLWVQFLLIDLWNGRKASWRSRTTICRWKKLKSGHQRVKRVGVKTAKLIGHDVCSLPVNDINSVSISDAFLEDCQQESLHYPSPSHRSDTRGCFMNN